MTSYAVQLQRLNSVPLAVIRRQASASDLARVVPECCGLVWNVVRAEQTQAGRHVAIYWDGSIRLEVGVELHGPFAEHGDVVRSATPAGAVASATHFGPYSGLGAAHDAVPEPLRRSRFHEAREGGVVAASNAYQFCFTSIRSVLVRVSTMVSTSPRRVA